MLELPVEIRQRLETLKKEFEPGDWRSYVAFDNAKSKWHEMRQFVQDEMDRNPGLREAYLYFNERYFGGELREAFD